MKMENLKIKKYKKGDKMAGIYLQFPIKAGEDMCVVNAYGIYADLFDKGKFYICPNVQSMNKGSGRFLDFLITLRRGLDKPVFFATITNQGIYKYLEKAGIGVVKDGKNKRKFIFYKIQPVVAYQLQPITKLWQLK